MTEHQYQRNYRDLYLEIDRKRFYTQYTMFECVKISKKTKALIKKDEGYSESQKEHFLLRLLESEQLAKIYFDECRHKDVHTITNVIRPIQGILQEILRSFRKNG